MQLLGNRRCEEVPTNAKKRGSGSAGIVITDDADDRRARC